MAAHRTDEAMDVASQASKHAMETYEKRSKKLRKRDIAYQRLRFEDAYRTHKQSKRGSIYAYDQVRRASDKNFGIAVPPARQDDPDTDDEQEGKPAKSNKEIRHMHIAAIEVAKVALQHRNRKERRAEKLAKAERRADAKSDADAYVARKRAKAAKREEH